MKKICIFISIIFLSAWQMPEPPKKLTITLETTQWSQILTILDNSAGAIDKSMIEANLRTECRDGLQSVSTELRKQLKIQLDSIAAIKPIKK